MFILNLDLICIEAPVLALLRGEGGKCKPLGSFFTHFATFSHSSLSSLFLFGSLEFLADYYPFQGKSIWRAGLSGIWSGVNKTCESGNLFPCSHIHINLCMHILALTNVFLNVFFDQFTNFNRLTK